MESYEILSFVTGFFHLLLHFHPRCHIVADPCSFSWLINIPLQCVYPCIIGGRLGCFCFLALVNSSAVNMSIQISVRVPASSSVGYIPRITGSYGDSIFNF